MFRLYGALLRTAWAAVIPYEIVIGLLLRRPRPPIGERLGRAAAAGSGGFWVHAVSVGEVRLALPIIEGLRQRFPGRPIHLTTSTATGRAMAEAARAERGAESGRGSCGGPDSVSALPIDLPGPMGRLLDTLRPLALLVIETEIWPNLLRSCAARGVPAALVNGRISPRAFRRYRAARPILRRALPGFTRLGMQSRDDAARIVDLGAPGDRVLVTGNLKYDLPLPRIEPGEARARLRLAPGDRLFVAGSTAPGEEDPVVDAFLTLRRGRSPLRLAVAPRHPADVPRAARTLKDAGLRVASFRELRDSASAGADPYDALIVDVLGVLPEIYAAADVVFVGGSLTRRGGQNILEPAALGKPVIFGPNMQNFRAAAEALCDAGAGFVARDGSEIAALASRFLDDPAAARVSGTMARRVVEANRGALERTLRMIAEAPGIAIAPVAGARTARP